MLKSKFECNPFSSKGILQLTLGCVDGVVVYSIISQIWISGFFGLF